MNWLLNYLEEQKIDVLIHTGDIFDRHNASSRASSNVSRFLSQASKISSLKKIIMISGNHDSNRFLDALYPLLQLSTDISFHLVAFNFTIARIGKMILFFHIAMKMEIFSLYLQHFHILQG